MSVVISPAEVLSFKRPLTKVSEETLVIENNHTEEMAFKVKTTAPKVYCVRPNAGTVPPGGHIKIQVMMQAHASEPPASQKCKDKFLIQAVPLNDDLRAHLDGPDLWSHVDARYKDTMYQKKLRCAYVDASEAPAATNGTDNGSTHTAEVREREFNSAVDTIDLDTPELEDQEVDELTKLQLELDAYRNEVEALRARAPDAPKTKAINKGVPLPIVLLAVILSFVLSFFINRN
ncbi:PapD-like protein [Gongronella butleri]|nr:PapD-like protein [Gongronella butleri]